MGARLVRPEAVRTVLLCAFSALMILSDCMYLLGDWAYNLKYAGIVLVCGLCVYDAVTKGVSKKKLALGVVALVLLVVEFPFQTGSFSMLQAFGLYCGVFVLACLSCNLFDSTRQLLIVCLFATVLVLVLLALTFDTIVVQLWYYMGVGRPRIGGAFSNPNSLGHIAAIIFIGVVCARKGERFMKVLNVTSIVLLLVTFVLVIASGSRGALLTALGFVAGYYVLRGISAIADRRLRILASVFSICVVAAGVAVLMTVGAGDESMGYRLETIKSIDFTHPSSLWGIGYVSSQGVRQLLYAANGKVDTLFISLYFRVGIVGIVAYVLLVVAAMKAERPMGSRVWCLAFALLFAILIQSSAESYFSSIMSFVSCFDWIALSAFPHLIAREEAGCA